MKITDIGQAPKMHKQELGLTTCCKYNGQYMGNEDDTVYQGQAMDYPWNDEFH